MMAMMAMMAMTAMTAMAAHLLPGQELDKVREIYSASVVDVEMDLHGLLLLLGREVLPHARQHRFEVASWNLCVPKVLLLLVVDVVVVLFVRVGVGLV